MSAGRDARDPAPGGPGLDRMALVRRLFPICRSITGAGTRETLAIVGEHLPLEIHAVPSGTPVCDWTVPREWNIRDAWVADADGRRVVDFRRSNLHVVNYSAPVRATMSLAELRPHLHSLPDQPDRIPYRTTYYREDWGFCLRHRDLQALAEGPYEVVIDATLTDGHLHYGELLLPGRTDHEVLLTTHVCHPSLANDNLSGIAVLTAVGLALATRERRHSYRLLFIPGTIGAITWLARNPDAADRVRHGLVLAGLGARQPFTYKRSRRGDAAIDRVAADVLSRTDPPGRILDFSPYGYDERQFCSPGFDLPVGRLTRAEYGTYPEYHTSGDDLDFVSADALAEATATVLNILAALEDNPRYRNLHPRGEPQLGRRGLYDDADTQDERLALLWVLNLSDGTHGLRDIALRAGMPLAAIAAAADRLVAAGLLAPADPGS